LDCRTSTHWYNADCVDAAVEDGREAAGRTIIFNPREVHDPPITLAEALAVNPDCDTTICRWHKGQLTHLNVHGKVYFCPIGRMYWRYTKQPSEFLRPLSYPKIG